MKESYVEGLAPHNGPESCVVARKGCGEALTGERTGRVLSREIHAPEVFPRVLRGADALEVSGRPHRSRRHREASSVPARSETPCTFGSTLRGNREILGLSVYRGFTDRIGKSKDARR